MKALIFNALLIFSFIPFQTEEAVGSTHKFTKVYAELTKLRKEPSMLWGQFLDAELNDNIFAFVRKAEGHPSFLIAINFGTQPSSDDYTKAVKNLVPAEAEVVFNSYNFEHDELALGNSVKMNNILLKPGEAVIFKYPWQEYPLKRLEQRYNLASSSFYFIITIRH
jgi:hypothetical protein